MLHKFNQMTKVLGINYHASETGVKPGRQDKTGQDITKVSIMTISIDTEMSERWTSSDIPDQLTQS